MEIINVTDIMVRRNGELNSLKNAVFRLNGENITVSSGSGICKEEKNASGGTTKRFYRLDF